jgi:hypothetical protein
VGDFNCQNQDGQDCRIFKIEIVGIRMARIVGFAGWRDMNFQDSKKGKPKNPVQMEGIFKMPSILAS